MKKSIVILLAVATVMSCNKKQSTTVNTSGDSMEMSTPTDSTPVTSDSASTSTSSSAAVSLNDQDKKFADAAAKGGMMEVMAGELAVQNATNATVKTLAEMMVKDHTKANDELKQWAAANSYTLPSAIDADQKKKYDGLKAKKGADFDKMYADMMVNDHKKTIADFKKESAEGSETSLKAFASKTIPALEHHLMESEKAKKAVK